MWIKGVVQLGQGAHIPVHKAVLGSDVPFQCTPLAEIRASVYHCGTSPVSLLAYMLLVQLYVPCCTISSYSTRVALQVRASEKV